MGVDVFSYRDELGQDGREFLYQGTVCHAASFFA
jgi:hypothetical protein